MAISSAGIDADADAEADGDQGDPSPPDAGEDEVEAIAPVRCARPGPRTIAGWVDDIIAAYAPPATTGTGRAEAPNALLAAAVRGCLASRAAAASAEQADEVVGVVAELVGELDAMGPEWSSLREVRPLAFTVYYLWAHIVIDQISDDVAMEAVRAATARLADFDRPAPGAGRSGRQSPG